MVLMAIVGELGIGKTLTLTYIGWENWFYRGRKIYSNYTLYGVPFTPIKTLNDLKKMIPSETPTLEQLMETKEIVFLGDELWRWCDSRLAVMDVSEKERKKIRNKIVADILGASRKAFVTVVYTTQTMSQVDKRIREVTDFTVYPIIKGDIVHAPVFMGSNPKAPAIEKVIRFYKEPFYAIFNTYERIQPLEEGEDKPLQEIVIPIRQNPAWIYYLKKFKNLEDEQIEKETKYVEKMLLVK